MSIIKMFVAFAFPAKRIFQLSIFIVMQNMLRAITVRDVKIAIFENRCFSWHKCFLFFISRNIRRRINGQQYFPVDGGFIYLMSLRIRDV